MRLADTVVLVGALNPKDGLHQDALLHLKSITTDPETFLPISAALEFDLVLKGRGYTNSEREVTLDWLVSSVPSEKLACNTLPSLSQATILQEKGMGYFDSVITALALSSRGTVITTDKEISKAVETDW